MKLIKMYDDESKLDKLMFKCQHLLCPEILTNKEMRRHYLDCEVVKDKEKFAALEDAGVKTVRSLADIGAALKEVTGW